MRHLVIYEAFKAKIISSTINYLKDKVGADSAIKFKTDILELLKSYDILVDSIEENEVMYINSQKAKKIESEKVNNKYGIKYLKFWFSLEKGYMGYTSTGNEIKFNPVISNTGKNKSMEAGDIKRIIQGYWGEDSKATTGILTPVEDYTSLRTGQDIFFQPGSSGIIKGVIYIQNDGRIFALHNNRNGGGGSAPEDGVWRNFRHNGQTFTKSWSLGLRDRPGNDHRKLNFYTKSDDPLSVGILGGNKFIKWCDNNNPVQGGKPKAWKGSDITQGKDIFENSSFAVVLDLDKIITKQSGEGNSYSKTISKRRDDKLGATALMSDEDIKKMNIDRYIRELVGKMGIVRGGGVKDMINLEKIIMSNVGTKMTLINIIDAQSIGPIIEDLSNLRIDRIIERYKDMKSKEVARNILHTKMLEHAKKSGIKEIVEFLEGIENVSQRLNKMIKKSNVNTLGKLLVLSKKIEIINSTFGNRYGNQMTTYMKKLFLQINTIDEFEMWVGRYDPKLKSRSIDMDKYYEFIHNIEDAID